LADAPVDDRTAALAGRGSIRALPADDPAGLARALTDVLGAAT
jgi:hypothetical protein